MKEKRIGDIVISVTCVIIIAVIVGVLTLAAGYTVLIGDDFTHGVRVGAFHVSLPSYFAASLGYVRELYLDWQGTFFAMFLQAFLSPINNFGLPQLKAVMMGNALFYLAVLLGTVWTGLSFFGVEKKDRSLLLVILTILFAAVTNADVYTEIYFWFSGAVAYSMPFSVCLVAILLFLFVNKEAAGVVTESEGRADRTIAAPERKKKRGSAANAARRKTRCAVAAGILLFLSSGGSLTVAGAGCYLALLLTFVFWLRDRRFSVPNLAILAAGVTGALINVVAPGNYARHDGTAGAGLHFGKALVNTARMFVEETGRLARETVLGLLFLVMMAIGLYLAGRCRIALREYGLFTVFTLAAGPVAEFPVALGYDAFSIPNRCYFIIDTLLVLSLLNLALFAGICLHRIVGIAADGRTLTLMLYVCLAALIVTPLTIEELPLYRVTRSIHNGSYREYHKKCVALYDYLETCSEQDVVLTMPDYIADFECFYFDSDPAGWVNQGIAAYYGKASVRRGE